MAVRVGGPCCHFHRAKEGLLLAALKGPGLKGFLRSSQARLCSSDKGSCEVLTGCSSHTYMWMLEWLQTQQLQHPLSMF